MLQVRSFTEQSVYDGEGEIEKYVCLMTLQQGNETKSNGQQSCKATYQVNTVEPLVLRNDVNKSS